MMLKRLLVLVAVGVTAGEARRAATTLGNVRGFLWRDPTRIPYVISSSFTEDQKNRILDAMKVVSAKTCVRFKPRGVGAAREEEWISFGPGDGCSGSYGRQPPRQFGRKWLIPTKITLDGGCFGQRTIIHEILHTLGMAHEQSRYDRDQYVTVHEEEVIPEHKHNFDKGARPIGPYDYKSIMHYSTRQFAKGSKPTITAPEPIAQEPGMSQGDINTINFLYLSCQANPPTPYILASIETVNFVEPGEELTVEFVGRWTDKLEGTAEGEGVTVVEVKPFRHRAGHPNMHRVTIVTKVKVPEGSPGTIVTGTVWNGDRKASTRVDVRVKGVKPRAWDSRYSSNVPGLVRAVDFIGEPGTFRDNTAGNSGNDQTRATAVDTGIHNGTWGEPSPLNFSNIEFVGWTQPGEWIEYKVRVREDAKFAVNAIVSAPSSGGKLRVRFQKDRETNQKTTPEKAVSPTGQWYEYAVQKVGDLWLEEGIHTMRVMVVAGGFNLYGVSLAKVIGNRVVRLEDFHYGRLWAEENVRDNCVEWKSGMVQPPEGEPVSFSVAALASGNVLLSGRLAVFTANLGRISHTSGMMLSAAIGYFNGVPGNGDSIKVEYRVDAGSWVDFTPASSTWTRVEEPSVSYTFVARVSLGNAGSQGKGVEVRVTVDTEVREEGASQGIFSLDDVQVTGDTLAIVDSIDQFSRKYLVLHAAGSGEAGRNLDVTTFTSGNNPVAVKPTNGCIRHQYDPNQVEFISSRYNSGGSIVRLLPQYHSKAIPVLHSSQSGPGLQAITFVIPATNAFKN